MVRKIYLEAKSAGAVRGRQILCFVGLAGLLVAGCDRSDETGDQTHQCARFCNRLETCDDGTDVLDCRKHCESDEVRSQVYFLARADCAEDLSCNLWVSEVDSQGDGVCAGEDCDLNECLDRALLKEKLSDKAQHSCAVIASMLRACDPGLVTAAVADECEQMTPMLSENYLKDSEACVLSECAKIESCLSNLADRQSTDLKVFSGTITPR